MDSQLTEYSNNDVACRRDTLSQDFYEYSRTYDGPLCLCCDLCQNLCTCSHCSDNHLSFTLARSGHILILIQHIEDFNGIVFSIRTLEKWYKVFPIP